MDIIAKLKNSNITGRSGSGFSTGAKWSAVARAMAGNKSLPKDAVKASAYIICNASEGELGVFKDEYLLRNKPVDVIKGIRLALEIFPNSEAYIYLRKDLYKDLSGKLKKIIGKSKIKLFREPGGYLCGEETTLIETIEKKRAEPRIKPPYPPQKGLWGRPTLVNNTETFYYINKISQGEYKNTRLVCLSGDIKKKEVKEVPLNWSVRKILKETGNYPANKFFVQVGGGACGQIRAGKDLDKPMCGIGSIVVFDDKKTDTIGLMKKWTNFYLKENCGKCVPCREGFYRINEILKEPETINWASFREILEVMQKTSFCGLGLSAPTGFLGLMEYRKIK